MTSIRSLFVALALILTISLPAQAMQLTDPRAAAVYIQKQRPLINGCLKQAYRTKSLDQLWQTPACKQLLLQDQQLKTAWNWILPGGSSRGIAAIPYELRKPTIDAYSEYKRLAERIAQLSRY